MRNNRKLISIIIITMFLIMGCSPKEDIVQKETNSFEISQENESEKEIEENSDSWSFEDDIVEEDIIVEESLEDSVEGKEESNINIDENYKDEDLETVAKNTDFETVDKKESDMSQNEENLDSEEKIIEQEIKEDDDIKKEDNTIKENVVVEKTEENLEKDVEEETEEINIFSGYTLIETDGGDLSGYRTSKVVTDIGFREREYWAFTNEYGQLVRVIAKEIILQDDDNEPVTSKGRYYWDEAKVPGTEHSELDEGHVIADSLGGVANAYNITPQNSTLNRHGEQAYMEETIRQAGGCTDFEANIIYPDKKTQIPSYYAFTYKIDGEEVIVEFENINPEEANEKLGLYDTNLPNELKDIDTNGNGQVTIAEAKEAGYKMPISSDHWLYEYMYDGDGDGFVGE